MDTTDALSRSRCHERRFNNSKQLITRFWRETILQQQLHNLIIRDVVFLTTNEIP